METVTSSDGTTIAFDRFGEGPPVILVCGGSVDRMADVGLARALAPDFTVLNYDRRGRGDSGDTLPYAIEREVEVGSELGLHARPAAEFAGAAGRQHTYCSQEHIRTGTACGARAVLEKNRGGARSGFRLCNAFPIPCLLISWCPRSPAGWPGLERSETPVMQPLSGCGVNRFGADWKERVCR